MATEFGLDVYKHAASAHLLKMFPVVLSS